MTTNEQLRDFGLWCLQKMWIDGGGDIDGGAAQDQAQELGLLIEVTVDQPCGSHCYCADMNDGEFPCQCLRFTDSVVEAIARDDQHHPNQPKEMSAHDD